MENNQRSSLTKYLIPAVVIVLLFVSVLFFYNSQEKSESTTTTQPQSVQNIQETDLPVVVTDQNFQDGHYSATGNYVSPGGPREINVSVTLQDGIITDATFEGLATDPTSKRFQGEFGDNFKPMVIGKNINEVDLTKVSGSSLTPKGFNDALDKIREEARS